MQPGVSVFQGLHIPEAVLYFSDLSIANNYAEQEIRLLWITFCLVKAYV